MQSQKTKRGSQKTKINFAKKHNTILDLNYDSQ